MEWVWGLWNGSRTFTVEWEYNNVPTSILCKLEISFFNYFENIIVTGINYSQHLDFFFLVHMVIVTCIVAPVHVHKVSFRENS